MIVNINQLHPTQLMVGYQQVNEKVNQIKHLKHKKIEEYLDKHIVPIIIGPDGKMFIIDHHHFCYAAHIANIDNVYGTIVKDWSNCASHDEFWDLMIDHHYIWLCDTDGIKLNISQYLLQLPNLIKDLKDDPYRSLAGIIRKSGGYNKDLTPFSEFHWANFFRIKIPQLKLTKETIDYALYLSKSEDAKNLPGYII